MSRPFSSLIGNDPIKTFLLRTVQSSQIPQSLLFSGPEGVGKTAFALEYARMILEIQKEMHPDMHIYRPEGKIGMHSIQSMREFSDAVYLAPFEAKKKVFIIQDAHRMLIYSANALLKTFEEPPTNSVIILTTHAPEQLLPTILSRCQKIRFLPVSNLILQEWLIGRGMSPDEAAVSAKQAKGSVGGALKARGREADPLRALVLDFLATGAFRSYPNLVEMAKQLNEYIESNLEQEGEALREQLSGGFKEKPSAVQLQEIEKETEGYIALKKSTEARRLFELILTWARDVELLKSNGPRDLLILSEYLDPMLAAHPISIERAEKAIKEAILSLERSTPLNLCFETLFLKLQ